MSLLEESLEYRNLSRGLAAYKCGSLSCPVAVHRPRNNCIDHSMTQSVLVYGLCKDVIQEERSIFWEVTLTVVVRKRQLLWTMFLILNGYRDRAIKISGHNSVRFLFVGLDEERSLQKKGGCRRWIAGANFGCCCPHNETWRSSPTNNTRFSRTSCKVHWGWRSDCRTFIANCKKFTVWVYQICHSNIKVKMKLTVSDCSKLTVSDYSKSAVSDCSKLTVIALNQQ